MRAPPPRRHGRHPLRALSLSGSLPCLKVVAPEPGKSRATIAREIKQKEAAIEYLARRYSNAQLPPEELRQCLYSMGDNHAYLYQASS